MELTGAEGQDGFAENGLRKGLNMESKMQGIPKEISGFWSSLVLEDRMGSQKIDLELDSIWRAKCKEFY